MTDKDDSGTPRAGLVEVYASGSGLRHGRGALHRLEKEHRCDRAAENPRVSTDLITAAVADGHSLCSYCNWPEGAEEVLENGE